MITKYLPQLSRIGRGEFFRDVFIATAALEEVQSAASIGGRLKNRDLLVAVLAERVDLSEQVASLAGRHVADEQPQKLAASQSSDPLTFRFAQSGFEINMSEMMRLLDRVAAVFVANAGVGASFEKQAAARTM